MITKSVSECRGNISGVLDEVQHKKHRVMIERNGRPAAALIPIEDFELLRRLEDEMVERERLGVLSGGGNGSSETSPPECGCGVPVDKIVVRLSLGGSDGRFTESAPVVYTLTNGGQRSLEAVTPGSTLHQELLSQMAGDERMHEEETAV